MSGQLTWGQRCSAERLLAIPATCMPHPAQAVFLHCEHCLNHKERWKDKEEGSNESRGGPRQGEKSDQ